MRARQRLLGVLLLTLAVPVSAFGAAPKAVGRWEAGSCRVELKASPEDEYLALRTQCPLSAEQTSLALDATLPLLEREAAHQATYRSMFIGRVVDYPWLSRILFQRAMKSDDWDTRTGRPRSDGLNAYVARLLAQGRHLDPFGQPLIRAGLRIVGVSVEKVLVLPLRELSFSGAATPGLPDDERRVPFDALVHLRLAGLDER